MSVDNAQYDSLAAVYDTMLRVPTRRCDMANLLAATTPLVDSSTRVLDLATGTGVIARAMAQLGAAHVVGIDVSDGMLRLARHLSSTSRAVHFEAGDVFASGGLELAAGEEGGGARGTFDLVTAVWCLNYAGDRAMMRSVWRNIAGFLKPGGRFVGVVPNSETIGGVVDEGVEYYGFSYERVGEVEEGFVVRATIHAAPEPFTFNFFHLWEDVYRSAAEEAGMVEVRLEAPTVVPEREGDEDQEYWGRYLERPLFKIMTAVKP